MEKPKITATAKDYAAAFANKIENGACIKIKEVMKKYSYVKYYDKFGHATGVMWTLGIRAVEYAEQL